MKIPLLLLSLLTVIPAPVVRGDLLFGYVNQDFIARFKSLAKTTDTIKIGSVGGDAAAALGLTDEIRAARTNINIVGFCVSACAEMVMPAASAFSELHLIDSPVVAYHHNLDIIKEQFVSSKRHDFFACFGSLYSRIRKFDKDANVPAHAWKEQARMLGLASAEGEQNVKCNDFRAMLERADWFPTAGQLRSVYGLHFSGSTCADTMECTTAKIFTLGKDGEKFVVGNKCFVISRAHDVTTGTPCDIPIIADQPEAKDEN